jgi:hypothetical protein
MATFISTKDGLYASAISGIHVVTGSVHVWVG